MRMIILGPPGAGKGTQASGIAERFGIPAISTGDMFRENIANETELGKKVKAILAAGEFVSDDITDAMLFDRLGRDDAKNGFLLDGYPRTIGQVESLDHYLAEKGQKLDVVLQLTVNREEVVGRLRKRAQIEGRIDDTEDVINNRMDVYVEETKPLIDVYQGRGLLVPVDGMGAVAEVTQRIDDALDKVEKA